MITKGFSANMSGSLALNGVKLLTIYIAINFYGLDKYGVYVFSLTIVMMSLLFVLRGLDLSLIKYLNEHKGIGYFAYSAKIVITRSLLLIPVLIIGGYLVDRYLGKNDVFEALNALLILLITESLIRLVISVYKSKLKMGKQYEFLLSREVMFIFLMLAFTPTGIDNAISISFAIASLFSLGYALLSLWKYDKQFFKQPKFKVDPAYSSLSGDLMYNALVNRGVQGLDIIIIGLFLNANLVGAYAILIKFSGFMLLIQKSFRGILYPVYTRLRGEGGITSLSKIFKQTTWVIFLCTSLVGVGLFLLEDYIFSHFKLENISSVSTIFFILLIARVVFSVSGTSGSLLITLDHSRKFLASDVMSLIILATLMVVLVPQLSLLGAALSFLVSMIFMTSVRLFLAFNALNIEKLSLEKNIEKNS